MGLGLLFSLFLILSVVGSSNQTKADDDIVLKRIIPDPSIEEYTCPNHPITLQCYTLIQTSFISWTLPTDDDEELVFGAQSNVNAVIYSSDGQFIATLTEKTTGGSSIRMNSSLLVVMDEYFTNMSTVICSGGRTGSPVKDNLTIILSGVPDPPMNITHDITATGSSVQMQWHVPYYTGGVPIMNYTIDNNDRETVIVSDDDRHEVVSYTSPDLIYGEVNLTAINSCGLQSRPVTHQIAAKKPPNLTKIGIDCSALLQDSNHITVKWEQGPREHAIVYPEEENITVELYPGDIVCNRTSKTNCVAMIEQNAEYRVNASVSNVIGTTFSNPFIFNSSQVFTVESDLSKQSLSIIISILEYCYELNFSVSVCIGKKGTGDDHECNLGKGVLMNKTVLPGHSGTFNINNMELPLLPEESYCYNWSLGNNIECDTEATDTREIIRDNILHFLLPLLIVVIVLIAVMVMIIVGLKIQKQKKWWNRRQSAEEKRDNLDRYEAVNLDTTTGKEPTGGVLNITFEPSFSLEHVQDHSEMTTITEPMENKQQGLFREETAFRQPSEMVATENTAKLEGSETSSAQPEGTKGSKQGIQYTDVDIRKPSSTLPLSMVLSSEPVTYATVKLPTTTAPTESGSQDDG